MKMLNPSEADRFGFDWPDLGGECHVQVTRTASVRWKGRDYRYLTVRTPTEELELRIAPKGQIRIFKQRKGKLLEAVYI